MNNNIKNKNQRGSVLIYSFLVMIMIMSIAFAILGIFIPKIRIASDPGRSVFALYAADSGLEWCLYVNRAKPSPPAIAVCQGGNQPGQGCLANGATFALYFPSSGFTAATCATSETPFDHRVVGTYQGVARSLEIH